MMSRTPHGQKWTPPALKSTYDDHTPASDATGIECKDPTKTQQHMAEETDINVIVSRFTKTGELPQRTRPPMTGDFTTAPDMQQAMDLVVQARVAFMEQPAEIRSRFNNNPVEFVNFCSDEKNRDEMRKMGLWSKEASDSFELQAQTQKDLDRANAAAAAELKALKKGKGDT